MSIYDESMRYVQLVSGLLEQTSISAVVKRLSTPLGVELVDALTQYSNVLDIFDEVVSWREMAISSMRSPVAAAGADRRITSLVPAEDSILAMLFRPEEDLEPLAHQASSMLFQARSYTTLHTLAPKNDTKYPASCCAL